MKNTFTREGNLNNWMDTIQKLEADLQYLVEGKATKQEITDYVTALQQQIENLDYKPEMAFLMMDAPNNMPLDARVEFVYWPSYVALSFIAQAMLQVEELQNRASLKHTVYDLMNGCMGRSFCGHGYRAEKDKKKVMALFQNAEMDAFLEVYADLNPKFTEMYRMKAAM